jgi:hypothetical protein
LFQRTQPGSRDHLGAAGVGLEKVREFHVPGRALPREIGGGLFEISLISPVADRVKSPGSRRDELPRSAALPAGVAFRYRGGHFTGEEARLLLDEGLPLVHRVWPGRIVTVQDWRLMTSYEDRARELLTEWVLQNRSRIHYAGVAFPRSQVLVRMGLRVAIAVLAVSGVRVRLDDSVEALLAEASAALVE